MNYQVLARKYRPKSFAEMVGQTHVLRALQNAMETGRLHHAYLFTGTRGVGKTTFARIIVKCLNCETGITHQPCGVCNSCKAIDEGRFIDLLEIDAASRTKVEDTRELLENIQYAPTQGRYKVYLIDEVHMLSNHSFNALLKTLEEPPPHVIFLLATTDPERIPLTVLSRCLQFNLKCIAPESIADHLTTVLQQEHIEYEKDAIILLANSADGSMRDALSLLDQAIAYSNGKLLTADMQHMLGTIDKTHILAIIEALRAEDARALLKVSQALAANAADFNQALEDLLTTLHQISILQVAADALALDAKTAAILSSFAETFSAETLQLYYQIALLGRRDLPLAPNPHCGFEMVLLRMLSFSPLPQEPQVKSSRVTAVSPATTAATAISPTATSTTRVAPATSATNKITETQTTSAPSISMNWDALVTDLKLTGMAKSLAEHCVLLSNTATEMHLGLNPSFAPTLNEKNRERINDAINQALSTTLKITITVEDNAIMTPASKRQAAKAKQHAATVEAIQGDSNVQALLQEFGAELKLETITSHANETDKRG